MRDSSAITWPPAYTVIKSKRARHVRLKISVAKGLELVVPYRFNTDNLTSILDKKRRWIEKYLPQTPLHNGAPPTQTLPNEITLAAIEQTWRISYLNYQGPLQILCHRKNW